MSDVAPLLCRYDATQTETVIVAGVSVDGRTVSLRSPLTYTHAGQTVPTTAWGAPASAGPVITLASSVGLLTRNVVVMGTNVDDLTPNYGAHLSVGNLQRGANSYVGSVNISYAQLFQCGQQGMEHAALDIFYTPELATGAIPRNVVNGSSFSHSLNNGVVGGRAVGLVLQNNVFHRTFGTSVDLDKLVRTWWSCSALLC